MSMIFSLLAQLVTFYTFILLIRVLLTWIPNLDPENPLVQVLRQITDPRARTGATGYPRHRHGRHFPHCGLYCAALCRHRAGKRSKEHGVTVHRLFHRPFRVLFAVTLLATAGLLNGCAAEVVTPSSAEALVQEAPVEEPIAEPVDEPITEPTEEAAEEPTDEAVEDSGDESTEESPVAEGAPVPELTTQGVDAAAAQPFAERALATLAENGIEARRRDVDPGRGRRLAGCRARLPAARPNVRFGHHPRLPHRARSWKRYRGRRLHRTHLFAAGWAVCALRAGIGSRRDCSFDLATGGFPRGIIDHLRNLQR